MDFLNLEEKHMIK